MGVNIVQSILIDSLDIDLFLKKFWFCYFILGLFSVSL